MEDNKLKQGNATETGENGVISSDADNRKETVEYKRGMHPASAAHRFTPGNSLGGRPKQTQEQKDALAELRRAAPKAIETLIEIMGNKKARGADRLKAAEMAIQYTYGKAPQTVTVNANNTVASEIMRELQSIRAEYAQQVTLEEMPEKVPNGAPTIPTELA